MQFIDSHLHLQDYKTNNAPQIIAELKSKGFAKVVCASSLPSSWQVVAELAEQYPDMVLPAFGIHPWYIDDAPKDWAQKLCTYLEKFRQSWVGECGLDRLKAPSEEKQLDAFSIQIEISKQFSRPLNVHALKAENWFDRLWGQMPKRFMLHSFGGSLNFLDKALAAGAFISLSQAVFKRKNAKEIIQNIPLSRLLLESDGPFLSDYSDIPELARQISLIKQMEYQQLVQEVYNNFEEFNRGE